MLSIKAGKLLLNNIINLNTTHTVNKYMIPVAYKEMYVIETQHP